MLVCIYLLFFYYIQAASNTTDLQNYHKGVQMGCWGLVVYAFTSAICSGKHLKYIQGLKTGVFEPCFICRDVTLTIMCYES